ncbi:MAG: alkaline phosphatase [Bacillota bacterium]
MIRQKYNKKISILLVLMLLFSVITPLNSSFAEAAAGQRVKNVIMLIPDGMSVGGPTLARWYKKDVLGQTDTLAMDEIATGFVRTHWAKGPVTDSAPAGTAFATGHKTDDGQIGVLTAEEGKKPVATVLEAAKLEGKATGIIATSEIMHATPAAFSSHDPSRGNYNAIMKQQVYNGVDVIMGGGDEFFGPTGGGKRSDGADLRDVIRGLGYQYITTRDEMSAVNAGKLWGMFAAKDMKYEIERGGTTEPSLAEMTDKAVRLLSQDPDGFFLMVEGSKIDWVAHANDAVKYARDIVAFDDAVKVALDFAKQDGSTAVIVASDHANGGISVGVWADGKYADRTFADFKIPDNIDWVNNAHTGDDVALYCYTPGSVPLLEGVVDNTEVAEYMANILGVDLAQATQQLFVSATTGFQAIGASVQADTTDAVNPVLAISYKGKTYQMPANSNLIKQGGTVVKQLNGVTVLIGDEGYVSQQAIDYIKGVGSGSSSSGGGGGSSTPTQTVDAGTAEDKALREAIKQSIEVKLSLLNDADAKATITPSVIKELAGAGKSFTLENKGVQIKFAPQALLTEEVNKALQDAKASLELGAREVTAQEAQQVLSQAKLGESTGLFEIGSKVFDLTAQVTRSSQNGTGTTEKIKGFSEPVAVTLDLSNAPLSAEDIKKLTGVRYEKDAAGNVIPVKLGGAYDPVKKTFTFYTDKFSLYGVLKAKDLINIKLAVNKTGTTVNGETRTLDVAPALINNRTMVPLRFVGESMGAKVEWSDKTRTVLIKLDGKELKLPLGQTAAGLDTPPTLLKGRVLVPIRYVSESLGANVLWFPSTNEVQIVK